jgi:predicted  nucleic acid-binding Zn-ribbon protein
MTRSVILAVGLFVLCGPLASAAEATTLEEGVAELTRAVTRLVAVVERQAQGSAAGQDLDRLRVLVSLLDIRSRRYEALQDELGTLEDREESTKRSISSVESRIEGIEERVEAGGEEAELAKLRERLAELAIQLRNHESRLDHAHRRQLDIQGQLVEQERLVRDIEGLVEGWLAEFEWSEKAPGPAAPSGTP